MFYRLGKNVEKTQKNFKGGWQPPRLPSPLYVRGLRYDDLTLAEFVGPIRRHFAMPYLLFLGTSGSQ